MQSSFVQINSHDESCPLSAREGCSALCYTVFMQGNQLLQPQHRVLFAAAVFALVAIGIFLIVLKWPHFFSVSMEESKTQEDIEYEAKIQILREIAQSDPALTKGEMMTDAEKSAALQGLESSNSTNNVNAQSDAEVSAGPDESGFTQEEKLNILDSLNSNN